MNNEQFKGMLQKAGLTKKAFAELIGTSSQVVNNWNAPGRDIPYWVESWLTLYIENKECKELKQIIKEAVCKDSEG